MTDLNELLANALAHAARGWHVFPLWPGTKAPAVPDAWQHRASTDHDQIARWWATRPYNIGIAVGPSGLFVVDLDAPKPNRSRPGCGGAPSAAHGRDVFAALCRRHGQPVPADTYTVATPNQGWQLYYRHPNDGGPVLRNTKGGTTRSLGDLVDTRGHGGYVVAPGSIVNGRRYRVVCKADPARLPGWLTDVLRNLADTVSSPTPAGPIHIALAGINRRAAFLRAALTREAEHVRHAPKNRGNAILWGAAVALGQLVAGGDLNEALVTEVLEQAATAGGRRNLTEARATIRSGLRTGAERPRTV